MVKQILVLVGLAAGSLLGCAGDNPIAAPPQDGPGPAAKLTVSAYRVGGGHLKVMTRNVFFGTDLDPILAATPEEFPLRVVEAWGNVMATDFPRRAGALAAEIAQVQPHLVGLQEVALFRLQSPGDVILGNPQAAEEVVFDYLELLLDELARRGMHYRPVATFTGTDIELPLVTGLPPDDLRFTDREVILARSDVRVTDPQSGAFNTRLAVDVAGSQVAVRRGWASVEADVAGQRFRFFSTHLETAGAPPIQVAQAAEVVGLLEGEALPVVLVGDFNSRADGGNTSSYADLVAAGFTDLWARANPLEPGLTCCHADDLRNETDDLNRRIDLIFVRPAPGRHSLQSGVTAGVVGGGVMAAGEGLRPSDHAGVWARLRLQLARLASG